MLRKEKDLFENEYTYDDEDFLVEIHMSEINAGRYHAWFAGMVLGFIVGVITCGVLGLVVSIP